MSITRTLSVIGNKIGIMQPFYKAEICNRRSYLVDTFVTIPEFRQNIHDIENNEFSTRLLPSTYGSFYEIVLFGAMDVELLRCFFIMPERNAELQDLRLLTAYPEASAIATSFLQLSDTPNSYARQAGKVVAVRQDEKGLEFVACHCGATEQKGILQEFSGFFILTEDQNILQEE